MKKIFRILSGLALFFCAVAAALFLLHPRIPLGNAAGPLSSLLTRLTGSEQVIRGSYFVVPGAWITFSVENGSVELTGNDAFRLKAAINSAETTVHLWSLFQREINLDGVAVHGVTLDIFTGDGKESPRAAHEKNRSDHPGYLPFTLKQTGLIDLADIKGAVTPADADSPVTFHLLQGTGEFSQQAQGKFTIESVMNGRELKTDLEAGPLAALSALNTNWSFAVHLNHKSIAASVTGSVKRLDEGPRMTADISLSGEHFDDLASIMGLRGSRNQPFTLQGTTTLSKEEIRGDFSRVQLGNEILAFSASVTNYNSREPRYTLMVRDDSLNLDVLKGFIAREKIKTADTGGKTKTAQISRDDVILPLPFPFTNLILDLELNELVMAGSRARDFRLNAVMADGVVDESPFSVTFKNASLAGHFSLNINDRVPQLSAHYKTSSFDIGTFLKDLKLADDIVIHIENATTDLKTRGRTVGELFDNFAFSITAAGGEYEYRDPNTGAVLPVLFKNTQIVGVPGEKITATIQGAIGESPVLIIAELEDRRDEPPESVKKVPVTLQIQVAGTQWKLAGQFPLPIGKKGTVLHNSLTGERLSSLNGLLQLKLPEIGPYEMKGSLSIVPRGYNLNGIQVQVGSSLLTGDITVDTSAAPPEVRVRLEAQRIQLDDFEALLMIPQRDDIADQPPKEIIQTSSDEKQNRLTDQEILDLYDASIHIEVKEVLSGADHLGSGILRIEQRQGQFKVDPLEIRLPNGTLNIDLSIRPSPPDRLYTVNMRIEDFDYGFLARRFKPETDMSGILNLRASVESIRPDRQNILAHGSGYLDFSVQPRQLRSGVIDLWAVNLFSYLVPFLTPKGESKINCAAGRFNLDKGILRQDEFLIDTSRIRVKGTVEVDFNKQLIDATLRPIPKRPQFYSLSTPIKIQGRFSDLDAGVATGGVIATVIRLATSYIVVPLQWIIQNRLPENGTEACLQLVEERTAKEIQ